MREGRGQNKNLGMFKQMAEHKAFWTFSGFVLPSCQLATYIQDKLLTCGGLLGGRGQELEKERLDASTVVQLL